jgi:hypothetical protein
MAGFVWPPFEERVMRHASVFAALLTLGCLAGCSSESTWPDGETLLAESRKFIGPRASPDGFKSLWVEAQCEGPGGSYQTEIKSSANGALTFIQRFPEQPALVAGKNADRLWMLSDGEVKEAPPGLGPIIESHQFHLLALRPEPVYRNPVTRGRELFHGCDCWRIDMIGPDSQPVSAFIDPADYRLRGARVSRRGEPQAGPVEWVFDGWLTLNGNRLPTEVRVVDGQSLFTYRFSKIAFDELPANEPGNPDIARGAS